jgi:hypothetical protein
MKNICCRHKIIRHMRPFRTVKMLPELKGIDKSVIGNVMEDHER